MGGRKSGRRRNGYDDQPFVPPAQGQDNGTAKDVWGTWLTKKKEKDENPEQDEPRWRERRDDRGDREEPRDHGDRREERGDRDRRDEHSSGWGTRNERRDRDRRGERRQRARDRDGRGDRWRSHEDSRWSRDEWRDQDTRWQENRADRDLKWRERKEDLPNAGDDKDAVESDLTTQTSSSSSDEDDYAVQFGNSSVHSSDFEESVSPLGFGVIVYDMETIHDAERGTYLAKGMHECSYEEQMIWKRQSQIIEFAAIDITTGEEFCVRSRPEFAWSDVRSLAARLFAEDHGHDKIVKDETLPFFSEVWIKDILPFLQRVAGENKQLAIIAHNGDNFDHYVLEKELTRLGLMEGLPVILNKFDPIRTLKNAFGPEFGSGGRLTLGAIHTRHVPEKVGEQPLHQALADCMMLLEAIEHWVALRALLAAEIAVTFIEADAVENVCNMLVASLVVHPRLTMKQANPIANASDSHASHASQPSVHRQPGDDALGEGDVAVQVALQSVPTSSKGRRGRASGAGVVEGSSPSVMAKADRCDRDRPQHRSHIASKDGSHIDWKDDLTTNQVRSEHRKKPSLRKEREGIERDGERWAEDKCWEKEQDQSKGGEAQRQKIERASGSTDSCADRHLLGEPDNDKAATGSADGTQPSRQLRLNKMKRRVGSEYEPGDKEKEAARTQPSSTKEAAPAASTSASSGSGVQFQ